MGSAVQTASGSSTVNNEVNDSVIAGDINQNISVTNKIILSPSLQSTLVEKGLFDSFSNFFGGSIEIDEGEDLSGLITELKKRCDELLLNEEGTGKYTWKSKVIYDLECDLRTLDFLRFGHSYDTRNNIGSGFPTAVFNSYNGGYYKTQLVGYDTRKKFVIVWIEVYYAEKKPLIKRLFRSLSNHYDWYGPPTFSPQVRTLCAISVNDFYEFYSTVRVLSRYFHPWTLERNEILNEELQY